MRLVRITGSGFVKTGAVTEGHPVQFRHWQDVVNEADFELQSAANDETEEAAVEMWLEDPMSFQAYFNEEDEATVPAQKTAMFRRADQRGANYERKTASSSWDREFADAQAHARSVLANLGKSR